MRNYLTCIAEIKNSIMNPFSLSNPGFRRGRNLQSNSSGAKSQMRTRRTRNWIHKAVRLKESFGALRTKKKLQCSLLNVDGLTETSFADVKDVLSRKLRTAA